jgi:hypothetical protein
MNVADRLRSCLCISKIPSSSSIRLHLSLGSIVPDGVVGAQTNPLRDRTVLLLRLGELLLGAERLLGLYFDVSCQNKGILRISIIKG